MNEPYNLIQEDQLFRILPPRQPAAQGAILAVHGLTGNEHSMEVFLQNLSAKHWAILPRAPFSAKEGGFTWISEEDNRPIADNLRSSAVALKKRIDQIRKDLQIQTLPLAVMGFSQGAALSLVYALDYSQPGDRIALLAGFLPAGLNPTPNQFAGCSFFIAHGRYDEVVPIQEAHRLVQFIQACGGTADFCESQSAHKLNLACVKRLEEFLE